MSMLKVESVNQYYGGSHILRNVGFDAQVGEVTVVLGRNGVGKTTLLKSLMGVVPVKTGSITLDGKDITRAPSYERVRLAGSADRPAGLLSHGQKQWLEIAMLLMQEPKLLLLDEPVAGMSDEETERTAELFVSLAGAHSLVVVELDMAFVASIARKVTVLHEGSVLAEGPHEQVQNDPRVIEVYLGR